MTQYEIYTSLFTEIGKPTSGEHTLDLNYQLLYKRLNNAHKYVSKSHFGWPRAANFVFYIPDSYLQSPYIFGTPI
ncbi:hypothetical protein JCM12294_43970 [Desulfocicer niacini]